MLKLFLGRQRSGKTYNCIKTAESVAQSGRKAIMLVPEQFSFECQRHLLETLGPVVSNKIEIHSFTSLCEAICAVYGGLARHNVDDGTRYILVGQAVKNARDSLKMYSRYVNSPSFIREMMSVITELKQSSVTHESLLELSNAAESELFAGKLHDTALILSAYDALLKNRFVDPNDLISNTVASMRDNSFFAGKTVIIDEFKGFTEAQFGLLDRMIAGCDNVFVSLCCDSLIPDGETDIFQNVKQSAGRLMAIAKAHGVASAEPTVLQNAGRSAADIDALERFLSEKTTSTFDEPTADIAVCEAGTVYDEIDFVMNTIRRSVRENGLRYRDFVIISRGENVYSELVDELAGVYGIPCYTDKRMPAANLPFSVLLLSAVRAAVTLDTDEIMKLVKTGLVGLTLSEIATLENYVFVWSVSGKKWLEDWTMNTAGLRSQGRTDQEIEKTENEIKAVDKLRIRVIEPLLKLRRGLHGNAEQMCEALLRYVDDCQAIEHLRRYTSELENSGHLTEAEYQRAGYDVIIKVFDKITAALGDAPLSTDDFSEIFSSALGYETVGEIPQTQDQVIYGTADRIRPMRPKVVFVIGVNQDVFPASVSDSGLFTQVERELMIESGLNVADHAVSDCLDEKFLLYSACCCASDKVYLSYSRLSASGSAMEPSMEIGALKAAFPQMPIISDHNDLTLDKLETAESAFRKLAENFRDDSDTVSVLKLYFSNIPDYSDRLRALSDHTNEKAPSVSTESVLGLFGDELDLSASKADDFASCRFMYFCKYGIGARALQKVDFDPMTRGNIVHDCLEHFVNCHKTDIGQLDETAIRRETDAFCDAYLEKNCTDASVLDDKFRYMLEITKDTVAFLAVALNREFAVSAFRPKFCELKVGDGGDVKGIDVLTDNGHRVTLNGYIDRVDVTSDGKVRVIDYKTGSKGDNFKLSELLSGQNMQMLLYLYSVLKNGQELIGASIPAGVLYFPAKRHVSDEACEYIKMQGVVLDDADTVRQMEPDALGKIIPPHIRPTGSGYYKTDTVITEEAFSVIFRYIELLLQKIGNTVLKGQISPKPLKIKDDFKCKYCDYKAVCRFDPYREHNDSVKCDNYEALDKMKAELEEAENGD